MSGEALTAGRSATFEFLFEVGEIYDKCVSLFTGQRQQKVSAV